MNSGHLIESIHFKVRKSFARASRVILGFEGPRRIKNRQKGGFFVKSLTKLYYCDMLFSVREK